MTPEEAIAKAKGAVGGMFPGAGGTGFFGQTGMLGTLQKKKPEGYSQEEWDKILDTYGKYFNSLSPTKKAAALKNLKVSDIISYGEQQGVVKPRGTQGKSDIATELAGGANNQINENNRRLAGLDETIFEANRGDQEALAGLKGAQETASQKFHDVAGNVRRDAETANQNSRDLLAGLGKDYLALNNQDQSALADYLSATDPYMKEIMARTSDPADVQRQLDAYGELQGVTDKYKELTDPTVTAKERYLSEVARREFEQSDLSNRQAVSEQLANRGLRSGGQQIAMQQGRQQQLSQDRLLKELGIQAGAVDRSMKAMEGWNTASNNLNLQAGAIRTANDSQRQWEDQFKVNEATRISGLAGSRKAASDTTTKTVGERDKGYFDAGQDVEKDAYGRLGEANKADWQVGEKDYAMGGDYYNAATGTNNRRVTRAQAGLDSGVATGGTNFNLLADKLSVRADQLADEEEHNINARFYGS